jgi:hypothetical protein
MVQTKHYLGLLPMEVFTSPLYVAGFTWLPTMAVFLQVMWVIVVVVVCVCVWWWWCGCVCGWVGGLWPATPSFAS